MHEITPGQAIRTAPPAGDPGSAPDRPVGRRLITSAVALLVAAAGTSLAVWAFVRPEQRPPGSAVGAGTIAFIDGARGEVWTVRADGSAMTRFPLNVTGLVGHVAWSPDGGRLALEVQDEPCAGCAFDLFVVNADGTGLRRLTDDGRSRSPAWSPDGSQIAYARQDGGGSHIFVMQADGSSPSRVTAGQGFDASPTWSPDGSRLAFARASGRNSDIYAVNADGTGEVRLTDGPGWEGDPEWSPDGTRIAFVRDRPEPGIYAVAPDGAGAALLAAEEGPGEAQNTHLSWSPDGETLAFSSPRGPGWARAIYILDVGSGQVRQITERRDSLWGPAWRPLEASTSPGASAPPTAEVTDVLRLTKPNQGLLGAEIAVGEGSLWVPLDEPRAVGPASILRIDPATSQVVAEIPVPGGPVDLTVGGGSVWVVGYAEGSGHAVSRIDPLSNRVVSTVPLPDGTSGGPIVATDDAVWVGATTETAAELLRLDPRTGQIVDRVSADFCNPFSARCSPNDELVIGEGALWAAGRRQGTLLRLDLATHEVTTIPAENWNGLAVGEGAVWVARVSPGDEEDRYYGDPRLLVRIDARTGQVIGDPARLEGGQPDPVAGASGPFATGDGGVWLVGDGRDGGLVVAWFDPQTLRVESSVALTEWPYTDAVLDAEAGVIWVSHAYSITRVDVLSPGS